MFVNPFFGFLLFVYLAKNFANQTARGIDGKVWRSSQVKVKNSTGKYRTTYRWVPVK